LTFLEIKNLAYGADKTTLIDDLSFNLQAGERLLIRGQNGVGKSTLLRVLLGQIKPISGTVKLMIQRERIAYLPQLQNTEFHISLTLSDVLAFSSKKAVDTDQVEKIGLLKNSDLNKAWNTASGGERQKVLLTRVFLQDVDLIILDEPMNHLDEKAKDRVKQLIAAFVSKKDQRSMIIVCHEPIENHDIASDDLLFRTLVLQQKVQYG
jgi:ABC-type Mn2+/Zn2+ transport system ATPase subunit